MEAIMLTKQNAHRVTMVRRKDDPTSAPVPFRWRGDRRIGIGCFNHLIGEGDEARIIKPHEFGGVGSGRGEPSGLPRIILECRLRSPLVELSESRYYR